MRVIGLAGWSGAGKTTLIRSLIPELVSRGLTVSTIKHAHHGFDVDKPGKDSFLHRQAGAKEVLVSSSVRLALMRELRGEPEPPLAELLGRLSPVDLVIVEGFKREHHPKLEVYRSETEKGFLFPTDGDIEAIATDASGPFPIRHFALDDIAVIADWMLAAARPVDG
jgi:molybdopterin-guanine dinucleotide biosynthesis protein B